MDENSIDGERNTRVARVNLSVRCFNVITAVLEAALEVLLKKEKKVLYNLSFGANVRIRTK